MAVGINESVIEEIKARVDIGELISSYGIQLQISGSGKKGCCPFHNEKTPSFHINESKGYYHCFGCGKSGDVIKFVQEMDGLTFVEAVKRLAEQNGIQIVEKEDKAASKRKRLYALMAELAAFYNRCLKSTKEAEIAREYLDKRDLNEAVREEFLIGYAPNGIANIKKWAAKYGYGLNELEEAGVIIAPKDARDQGYHRFAGRLMFTVKDKQGRVVAFSGRQLIENKKSGKYVNSPETAIFKKSHVLYGFDKAAGYIARSEHREAIICEGQIDMIRLHISGFANAIASQGTAFTEEHVKMLSRVAEQVTLVFDDDAAGHKATIRSAALLLGAGMPVKVVSLPGGDDPDSFLRKHESAEFQKLLDNAESIMSFQVRKAFEKEANAKSVEAIARVTKEVLKTIKASSSAVIQASMLEEAARLMHLPVSALSAEMSGQSLALSPIENAADIAKSEPLKSAAIEKVPEPVEVVVEPSQAEMDFCEFLLGLDYDENVLAMVRPHLPREVFKHDFTWRFFDVWCVQNTVGRDLLTEFSDSLEGIEKKWFKRLFVSGCRALASGDKPTKVAEGYIRELWTRHFEDLRANIALNERKKRFEYTHNIKTLSTENWPHVKEAIREWMKGE